MKRNNLYLSLILVVFTLFSCTHRSYRMQTQVNRDGSCVRSISVETRDSAFIAGDTTANPLPIQLDTTWTVECYNGQQKVTVEYDSAAALADSHHVSLDAVRRAALLAYDKEDGMN